MKKCMLTLLSLWIITTSLHAQTFYVGVSYFSQEEHVEYIHGNLPIILSAPHGGEKRPIDLPDRNCTGCVYANDTNTQELTREVTAALVRLTGCYPHVIINRLHRIKLDANREIVEAADGNTKAEAAWSYYHSYIDTSRQYVTDNFGKGIFFDLHGHGHTVPRLELGYLLSKSDLSESDSYLDDAAQISKSSIRHLSSNNLKALDHSELIRGDLSFGTMVEEKNIPAVPSSADPFPLSNESYFTGGYNTRQYGSSNSGTIDAIQIECHRSIRIDENNRKEFADSLAVAMLEYLAELYFNLEPQAYCSSVSVKNTSENHIRIFPNPVEKLLNISTELNNYKVQIRNTLGQSIYTSHKPVREINLVQLEKGIYNCLIITKENRIYQNTFIKS